MPKGQASTLTQEAGARGGARAEDTNAQHLPSLLSRLGGERRGEAGGDSADQVRRFVTRRVEDWRGAQLSPFPAPASSNGANGFPVRRSPVCFVSWFM
jgi:hypothetical protein